jgi:hypothetical protein
MLPRNSVGFDHHSKTLQLCVISPKGEVLTNRRVGKDLLEAVSVVRRFGEDAVVDAESCNGSAVFLHERTKVTRWETKLCHPGYAQRMRHNPDWTDKSDGELIVDLTRGSSYIVSVA